MAALLASSVAFACSRATPPPTDRAAPKAEPQYAIAWGDGPRGVRSFWLEISDEQPRIRGELSGALFLVGGRVYRWKERQEAGQLLKECPPDAPFGPAVDEPSDDSEPDAGDNLRDTTVGGVDAELLDTSPTSERVEISQPPLSALANATEFSNTVELQASAGPYLFIHFSSDAMYCGALHGSPSFSDDTFDLANKNMGAALTKPELAELSALAQQNGRASLLACLAEHSDLDGHPLGAAQLPELELWNAYPVLSASGQLAFQVELGRMHSWVEGLMSCSVTLERLPLPRSLARFAPPRGLAALLKHEPKLALHGWSLLAATERDRVPVIDRVFVEQARRDAATE